MTLRVGAGLGRTGTHSLKLALEQLLEAPCYHDLGGLASPCAPDPVIQAHVNTADEFRAMLGLA